MATPLLMSSRILLAFHTAGSYLAFHPPESLSPSPLSCSLWVLLPVSTRICTDWNLCTNTEAKFNYDSKKDFELADLGFHAELYCENCWRGVVASCFSWESTDNLAWLIFALYNLYYHCILIVAVL